MSSKIGITPDEITSVLKDVPPGPALPAGSDALAAATAAMNAREKRAAHTRVVLYRFDGPAADPQADTYQSAITGGTLPLHGIAAALDCDLQLIELGRGAHTADDAARAAAFGMMAAEQDTGLLVVAAFGAGSDARASACDPQSFLQSASPETAALYGAMIGAARAGIAVIAEGPQGRAAARAVQALRPDLCARIFLCGVQDDVPGIPVFADMEGQDADATAIRGDAALTIAALFWNQIEPKAA